MGIDFIFWEDYCFKFRFRFMGYYKNPKNNNIQDKNMPLKKDEHGKRNDVKDLRSCELNQNL